MRRIDMHVHTAASFDCLADPEEVYRRCLQLGLDPVFITDHDSIDAAVDLRSRHPNHVVVGQEVTTTGGELIGLFLEEPIPPGLDPPSAARLIKQQGGLIYLEHPFDLHRRSLTETWIEVISDEIDIVETFNARSGKHENERARELRATLGVAAGAGSDAHRVEQLGSVYLELGEFQTPADLIDALGIARVVQHPSRALMMARRVLIDRIGRR